MNNKVVYPGTFDPVTNGHINIIERASVLFDEVVVAVALNGQKKTLFTARERETLVRDALRHKKNVSVVCFDNLLIDFVVSQKANVIIRGLRAASDFEFEFQLAGMNRQLNSEVETLFFTPAEKEMFLSSTLVREIASLKGDISSFVPANVVKVLEAKFK
jgi:pantetheine-phosphate adenylyltransferase